MILTQISQVVAPRGQNITVQGVSPVYEVIILFKSCKNDTFIFTIYAI
mgnify:CR=1 FL=1